MSDLQFNLYHIEYMSLSLAFKVCDIPFIQLRCLCNICKIKITTFRFEPFHEKISRKVAIFSLIKSKFRDIMFS